MFRVIFLIQSKSSFNVILNFVFSKIKNIFFKKKIIMMKKNHQLLLSKKKITNDYFSSHAFNFCYYLKKLNKDFNYLEIGSYEGNSAIFVAINFLNSKVYCVDNWHKTEEYINHKDFLHIEENFNYNTKNYKNIIKIKTNSDDFFFENKINFDAIYIDGYHYGPQVYKDCKNAWKFLKKNGYLILDDFIWNFYKKNEDNPCFVINKFLKEIHQSYKIEKVSNSQIFIKKTVN